MSKQHRDLGGMIELFQEALIAFRRPRHDGIMGCGARTASGKRRPRLSPRLIARVTSLCETRPGPCPGRPLPRAGPRSWAARRSSEATRPRRSEYGNDAVLYSLLPAAVTTTPGALPSCGPRFIRADIKRAM